MKRSDAMSRLQAHADALRAMGATSLYVFGSTARDEAVEDSDLDLFIDYDLNSRFNGFDLIGIKLFLEERLGAAIDMTTRDGLRPSLRERVEASALKVF